MPNPFAPDFNNLPPVIPVFPLTGALLLPGGTLPLNIFEPRYLNMTQAAMVGDRTIGMIQPTEPELPGIPPGLYRTGCAGRVTYYDETDDGRILVKLLGICRFDILEELEVLDGYRRVRADYDGYRADMSGEYGDGESGSDFDSHELLEALRGFLTVRGIEANWKAFETLPGDRLVTALSMMCPFEPSEKQALLEAADMAERGRVLLALLKMAESGPDDGSGHVSH